MSGAVRFVLVEPREAGNVGAAARAMKNFGFTEMVLVGALPPLEPLAGWWASGAEDVVATARRTPGLDAALEGAHLVVATTSSRARPLSRPLDPRELAHARSSLRSDQTLALVFGREDRGLTASELARCGTIAVVPTSDLHPTMNLAQAVGVFAYELSRPATPSAPPRELATDEQLERLHHAARELLIEVGFLHENNPDRVYDDLRALTARARLDPREVTILRGVIRQLRWRMGREE